MKFFINLWLSLPTRAALLSVLTLCNWKKFSILSSSILIVNFLCVDDKQIWRPWNMCKCNLQGADEWNDFENYKCKRVSRGEKNEFASADRPSKNILEEETEHFSCDVLPVRLQSSIFSVKCCWPCVLVVGCNEQTEISSHWIKQLSKLRDSHETDKNFCGCSKHAQKPSTLVWEF